MPWVFPRWSPPKAHARDASSGPGAAMRWRAAADPGEPRVFVFTGDRSLMVHVSLARSHHRGDGGSYRAACLAADRLALAVTLMDEEEILATPWTVMRTLVAVCARRTQIAAIG